MPRRHPIRRQVVEPARAGTRVKPLAATFKVSEASIYNWLKQDKIDRGARIIESVLRDTAPESRAYPV